MLDTTMLQMMGLLDNPLIIEMEAKRLNDEHAEAKIKQLIKRCMDNQMIREALLFDEDLAEAFIEAEVAEVKRHG